MTIEIFLHESVLMDTMNIIYIGTIFPHPGGSAISGAQIVEFLGKRGHRVIAISPIAEFDYVNRDHYDGLLKNVNVHRYTVPYYNTSAHEKFSEDYLRSEFEKIEKIYNDVTSYCEADIVLFGRETFAPLMNRLEKNKAKFVLRVAGATTLGIAMKSFSKEVIEMLFKHYKLADVLISPALHMVTLLNDLGLSNIIHIPNGVNSDKFNRLDQSNVPLLKELDIANNQIVVSHVSGLESIKRPMDFMEAARIILRDVHNVTFLVIGNGPCYKEMVEYSEQHSLQRFFRFVGWIDYERINEYFNISDVVVMPCEADTQPRVYLETMASGKTLLASAIPASLEIIVDGETGLLYPKGDINALIASLKTIIENSEKRILIGNKARKYVQSNHNWQLVIDKYEATFNKVVNQPT